MSYYSSLPPFDGLSATTKAMLGALLDYAGVDRERFANAWKPADKDITEKETTVPGLQDGSGQPTLFDDK